jgi:RNA polymerase sigma factor (sigma-70 family)
MLGSLSEAEDAVQEAWLRMNRSDMSGVDNLGGWLTTVVARLCLDVLRARKSHQEEPVGTQMPEPVEGAERRSDPEKEALLADSVGLALLVVLDTLPPGERVAYVLHDMFSMPFEEIAPIVGRTPDAARQLASRGRRRVHGNTTVPASDRIRQRQVVDAFLAASRGGDFEALVAVLDPDVVFRADAGASPSGAPSEIRGARVVARGAVTFASRGQVSRPALVNGAVGMIVAPEGRLFAVLCLEFAGDKILDMEMVTDPARLRKMDVAVLDD